MEVCDTVRIDLFLTAKRREYLPALTGLRFVLAVWVILHHISGHNMMLEAWTDALPWYGQSIVHAGYMAVQTFFILSGFVLARTYANSSWTRTDVIRYGWARIARIYPVYLISLAVVSPFIFETMLKPGRTPAEKTTLLGDYVLVLQGWTTGLNVGWNTPAWSLSCEFFFYLLFPFVFPFLRNAGRKMLACIALLAIVTPVLMAHANIPWEWKPLHHFSDFVIGIVAAGAYGALRTRMHGRGAWLYLPAMALGVYVILFPGIMRGTYGDLNTGLRPLNAIALLGFALSGGACARLLSGRTLDYLGKISYSMYILHVPVLWWYSHWAMHGPLHMPGTIATLVYFGMVTAVSAAAFRWVEMPANKWIRKQVDGRLTRRQPETVMVAAAA